MSVLAIIAIMMIMMGASMATNAVIAMEGDSVESCGKPASTKKSWASKGWAIAADTGNFADSVMAAHWRFPCFGRRRVQQSRRLIGRLDFLTRFTANSRRGSRWTSASNPSWPTFSTKNQTSSRTWRVPPQMSSLSTTNAALASNASRRARARSNGRGYHVGRALLARRTRAADGDRHLGYPERRSSG